MNINRDNIFARNSRRRYADVTVGDDVYRVQSLTESEVLVYEAGHMADDGMSLNGAGFRSRRGRLVLLTLVDADNNRIFGDGELDDVMSLPAALIARLYDAASAMLPRANDQEEEDADQLFGDPEGSGRSSGSVDASGSPTLTNGSTETRD